MAYTPFVWKDDLAGGTPITAARLNTIENAISASTLTAETVRDAFGAVSAGAYRPLAGTGIDLTGSADSTSAVQTLVNGLTDGDVLVVPPHAIIKLTGTITVPKRIRMTGKGKLSWSGIPNSAALLLTASGTHLDGLYIQGDGIAGQTGNTQYGIAIRANSVRVTNCHVDNLQQAITVLPFGEYHDNVISNNIVSNVPGSGDGASNTTSTYGEDRGDGIVNWGASCTITGNRVWAKDGADARVGIHTESLPDQEADTTYVHRDAMVAIMGNVVTGKFRRGIVTENVYHTTMTGNSVADSTWWCMAIINTQNCIIASNTLKYTRTSSDNQGAAWSVQRAAIMLYGNGQANIVQGNTVAVRTGATMPYGIYVQTDSTGAQNYPLISNNVITDSTNTMSGGIYLNGAVSTIYNARVLNNRVSGYTVYGVYGWNVGDPEIVGNRIDGVSGTTTGQGVHLENNNGGCRVDGNTIFFAATGILAVGRNAFCTFNNNMMYSATTGIDLYGTNSASIIGNRFTTVTTATANVPSGSTVLGNNF